MRSEAESILSRRTEEADGEGGGFGRIPHRKGSEVQQIGWS